MFTKRDKQNSQLAKKIALLQLGIISLLSLLQVAFINAPAAVVFFVGGVVGCLSYVAYSKVALKPLKKQNPGKIVGQFYRAGLLKYLTLAVLFIVALVFIRIFFEVGDVIYLLLGLVVSLLVQSVVPMLLRLD